MESTSQIIVGQDALGSNTPIRSVRMKGWLFCQGWLKKFPEKGVPPVKWTVITKGQVWNPPPPT